MKDRRDYERAIQIVGYIIRKWDPYGLISKGAPSDELDGEIAKVVAIAARAKSANELAFGISTIFSKAFEPDTFSPDDCLFHAHKILLRLRDEHLIAAA